MRPWLTDRHTHTDSDRLYYQPAELIKMQEIEEDIYVIKGSRPLTNQISSVINNNYKIAQAKDEKVYSAKKIITPHRTSISCK